MGSEPKEMKYRRRVRVPEPGEYAQCSDRSGAVDWSVLKQDPVELLRKLDEIRDQITRSCEMAGRPRVERYRMNRRAISLRPSHAEAPPPPPPYRASEYHRPRHASRYGPGLPEIPYEQRSVCDDKYARQQSGRFRQCQEGQWENYGYDQGNSHHSTCQCARCVHGRRTVVQEEHIPMARYFAGQQGSYPFERASSISSEYDRRSVASSLYSHLSMSKRRVEYFRKKAASFCRPIKGAAPFISCSSCNRLLHLPSEKCIARKQNQIQCGSCSEIFTFKLKEIKIHPVIPPSTFPIPKSVRTFNRRVPQSSGWYQHQGDDDSSFIKLQANDSQRQNMDFGDNISLSSTASFDKTAKERGSNRGIQLKSGSASRSRFANRPKDILCQGDADNQMEASVLGTNSPQAPILVDKLVDPFSSQRKHCSGMDQITSKECGLDRKSYNDSYVRVERSDMKYEEKRKEVCTDEFGEDINKTHGHNHKQDNAGCREDGSTGNKYRQKDNYDGRISHENEDMSNKYDGKSKQDDCSSESQGIDKRHGKCNKEDNINALEVESKAKTCKQGKIEGDYSYLLSSNCGNSNTQNKNDWSMNGRTNTSFVSSEAELDENQSSAGKSGDSSFFAGFLKKGFKDLSLFNQSTEGAKVSINGHPISERALRKVEKKAGPVSPGSYWYDHRAGFWGVMGHECSGIIPPYIKEFNYSMPKNCAGGNTGVFVNGRELHQKDFDLLVKRGLPCTSGKSYSVEISGNVIDDTSGKKLRNLGKLAPTVEKMKRGFGMHVPEEKS